MNSNMTNLTGLWKHVAKDGKTYYSGSLGAANLLVFANTFKKTEKDPDLNLFVAPKEQKDKPVTIEADDPADIF